MFQIKMLIFNKLQCQGENSIIHPGEGGTPLYGLYRYVRPQRVSILAAFGHFGHK